MLLKIKNTSSIVYALLYKLNTYQYLIKGEIFSVTIQIMDFSSYSSRSKSSASLWTREPEYLFLGDWKLPTPSTLWAQIFETHLLLRFYNTQDFHTISDVNTALPVALHTLTNTFGWPLLFLTSFSKYSKTFITIRFDWLVRRFPQKE